MEDKEGAGVGPLMSPLVSASSTSFSVAPLQPPGSWLVPQHAKFIPTSGSLLDSSPLPCMLLSQANFRPRGPLFPCAAAVGHGFSLHGFCFYDHGPGAGAREQLCINW